jgi:two-component system, chemotaxis family, protein-glutamate methylesterase/glutaminase
MRLSVLVCEDSPAYAGALRRMLEHDRDILVHAVCATAQEAIETLPRMEPDLLIMDAELPGMHGLEAVEEIMSSRPLPVLVLSGDPAGSEKAASALAAGALDALAKQDLDLSNPAGAVGTAFRQRIRTLSRTRVIRHPRARLSPGSREHGAAGPGSGTAPQEARQPARRAAVVGICASAGGPQMLTFLLGALPADYPIPILIVQHLSPGFTDALASWLDRSAALPVGVAEPGTRLRPGAWLAPEGGHLTLTVSGWLARDRRVATGRQYRPSGDVLLSSIALAAGRAAVAIVLSGMGSDGAAGAAAVHRAGGLAIAQDEQSSAVFGMPEAAMGQGVDVVLSPGAIASRLLALRHQPLPPHRAHPPQQADRRAATHLWDPAHHVDRPHPGNPEPPW